MTDLIEANSMGHEPDLIDIYSASWGPTDDGKTVDGPRNATMRAIVRGVNEVRTSFFLDTSSIHDMILKLHLFLLTLIYREEEVWVTFTSGHQEMGAKMMTVIVMDMLQVCGPFLSIQP